MAITLNAGQSPMYYTCRRCQPTGGWAWALPESGHHDQFHMPIARCPACGHIAAYTVPYLVGPAVLANMAREGGYARTM